MKEPDYVATREQHADAISKSAARLAWMCNSNIPNNMIEAERQLLIRKLILFPVDRDAQIACEIAENKKLERETEFLQKAGYFSDSEPSE